MYNLSNQIQTKGLHFFTPDLKSKNKKMIYLRPGGTVEEVYKKYATDKALSIIYSDNDIGLGGLQRM